MDDFDKELKKLFSGLKTTSPQPTHDNAVGLFLLACVVLLAAMFYSHVRNQQSFQAEQLQQREQLPQQQLPQENNRTQVDQRLDRLESGFKAVWDRSKWNSDKVTLLATIHNHNMVVIKNALPKSELILLNSDWTINRLPDRINLDQQDRQFLEKYLRKS
jgi:hypothetical protein